MQGATPASDSFPEVHADLMNSTLAVSAHTGGELTDEDLMVAFSGGSGDAFTALFSRYKQPIFGYFQRRLFDRERAEELTQETFIVLLRLAPRYESRGEFRPFLYSIAFRLLRSDRRRTAFRAAFLGIRRLKDEPKARENHEVELAVREALVKLERIDREVLLLREFEQLSYSEIAGVLKIPLNTVRSRLFRARKALATLLGARSEESRQTS